MLTILRGQGGELQPSVTGVFWAGATKVGESHLLTTISNGQRFRVSIFFCWVGLTSPGTAATSGLLYSPR
jgi:hypothetical protein